MSKSLRHAATLLVLALCGSAALAGPEPSYASGPQDAVPANMSADGGADPSGRVGRLSLVQGPVDFRSVSQAQPQPASLNWPLTSMNVLSTARYGRAELRIGSSVLQLDGGTELEISRLSDEEIQLQLHYGSLSVQVRNPDVLNELRIGTPQGVIRMTEPGRMRIDAGLAPDTTALSVDSGTAQFDGMGSSVKVRAGKRIEAGNDNLRTQALRTDAFDDWVRSRENIALGRADSPSARYVSPETTGYEELDTYGDWRVTNDYGPVWAPRGVASDWAPYREGQWSWVEPWGWTWVDNAPWGYAPSHYGRWVMLDRRWYWAPGRFVARPVWAPALVGWVGGGSWNVSYSGGSGPAVGWFPLAPLEIYVPRYRVSPRYAEHVNDGYSWKNTPGRGHSDSRNYRYAHDALVVLPQQHFNGGSSIVVSNHSRIVLPREQLRGASVEVDRRFMEGQYRQHRDDSRTNGREQARPVAQNPAPSRSVTAPQQSTPQPEASRESQRTRSNERSNEAMNPNERYIDSRHRRPDVPPAAAPVVMPAAAPVAPAAAPTLGTPPPAAVTAPRGRGENRFESRGDYRGDGRGEGRNDGRSEGRNVAPVTAPAAPAPAIQQPSRVPEASRGQPAAPAAAQPSRVPEASRSQPAAAPTPPAAARDNEAARAAHRERRPGEEEKR